MKNLKVGINLNIPFISQSPQKQYTSLNPNLKCSSNSLRIAGTITDSVMSIQRSVKDINPLTQIKMVARYSLSHSKGGKNLLQARFRKP